MTEAEQAARMALELMSQAKAALEHGYPEGAVWRLLDAARFAFEAAGQPDHLEGVGHFTGRGNRLEVEQ